MCSSSGRHYGYHGRVSAQAGRAQCRAGGKGRCLNGETSYTTAHLTCVTDTPLSELVSTFGRDHAQAVWDAQLAAIETIDRIVWREQIKCQFDWVPGYLFNQSAETHRDGLENEPLDLREEVALANALGFDAEFVDTIPLFDKPGIQFENQAIPPRKYLLGLLRLLSSGRGCQVFEQTEIEEIEDTPITATTRDGHRIHCERLLVATRAASGQNRPRACDGSSVEARPLHVVCGRRMGAARLGARSALLGYRRSLRLPARRSPPRS